MPAAATVTTTELRSEGFNSPSLAGTLRWNSPCGIVQESSNVYAAVAYHGYNNIHIEFCLFVILFAITVYMIFPYWPQYGLLGSSTFDTNASQIDISMGQLSFATT
jgi:hypothetical protein